MKKSIFLIAVLFATQAQAYTSTELRSDCQAAGAFYDQEKSTGSPPDLAGARCVAYLEGFAGGYTVGDYLADKVGVKLNAFCPPKGEDLPPRLVRSVLAHLRLQPLNPRADTAILVAGALAKSFPCADSLESRK